MISITKRFEFDAAHRVLGHQGACRWLHGHRYAAEVTVSSTQIDHLGMVVDFGILKKRVGEWIKDWWDHNIILNAADPLAVLWSSGKGRDLFMGNAPYILEGAVNNQGVGNPTAENLAAHLAAIVGNLLPTFKINHVRLYETPTSWADWY